MGTAHEDAWLGRWRLQLLGEMAVVEGPDGDWRPPAKASLLLTYLAIEGPTPRERLAGLLWPERAEGRARANLRQLLLRIRQRAPVVEGTTVLALVAGLEVDVLGEADEPLFAERVPSLLGTIDASDAPELEGWLERERERLAERLRTVLTERCEAARLDGDLVRASQAADRLAALAPWSEEAARTVMELALDRAEPATALRAFARLRATLESELGVAPAQPTLDLAERAARSAAGGIVDSAAAAPVPGLSVASNAEAGGWLEEGARLLAKASTTLTDPGELGRVLVGLAWLEHRLGRNDDAGGHAERGRALLQGADEAEGVAQAGFVLGSLAWARGSLDEARRRWDEALRSLPGDDPRAQLRLTFDLALVEDALGDQRAARKHYLVALDLAQAGGERAIEANILNNLGTQLVRDGRPADGRTLLVRARAIARELRDHALEGYVLDGLARALLAEVTERAGAAVGTASVEAAPAGTSEAAEALRIAVDIGDARLQIESLLTLADAARVGGARLRAGRYAGAALRRADRLQWHPLVASALVAWARAADDDDVRASAALRVVASDPAAGPQRAAAETELRRRGTRPGPADYQEVLTAVLEDDPGVTLE